MIKLRKSLCSDYNDKSQIALLLATDRVAFMLDDLHLSFYKCKIIFYLFYNSVIELIKYILGICNVQKDPIEDRRFYANSKIIEDTHSKIDRIITLE